MAASNRLQGTGADEQIYNARSFGLLNQGQASYTVLVRCGRAHYGFLAGGGRGGHIAGCVAGIARHIKQAPFRRLRLTTLRQACRERCGESISDRVLVVVRHPQPSRPALRIPEWLAIDEFFYRANLLGGLFTGGCESRPYDQAGYRSFAKWNLHSAAGKAFPQAARATHT